MSGPGNERPPFQIIDAQRAQELIAGGAVAVDVREQWEWNAGHIPEARLMPLEGIYRFGHAAAELPRDQDVVFVCESGQRSAVASEIALVAGLAPEHVHNLAGGMVAWRRAGLPTAK
jgi:rhodanese-related sulfurtransferase